MYGLRLNYPYKAAFLEKRLNYSYKLALNYSYKQTLLEIRSDYLYKSALNHSYRKALNYSYKQIHMAIFRMASLQEGFFDGIPTETGKTAYNAAENVSKEDNNAVKLL